MRQSGGEGGPGGYADDTRVSSMSSMVEGRFFRPMLCKGVLHTSVRLRPSPPSCPSAARPAHPTRRSARPPRAGRPSTSRRAQGRAGWRSRSGSGAVRYDGGQVSGEGHGGQVGSRSRCALWVEQWGNSAGTVCCAVLVLGGGEPLSARSIAPRTGCRRATGGGVRTVARTGHTIAFALRSRGGAWTRGQRQRQRCRVPGSPRHCRGAGPSKPTGGRAWP